MSRWFMPSIDLGRVIRCSACLLIIQFLIACTSMEARLSIEPYVKDKQKRNAIEWLAESYCQKKRNYPKAEGIKQQPDFIFTTDGCSRAPDDHWLACCIVHDIAYWCGGSQADRQAADQALKQCVNKQANVIGSFFYFGVRLGGTPWLPTPWRWGYGWQDWPHGYESLEHSPLAVELLEGLNAHQVIWEQLQK
jgi:hypothetical protein